jgi:hypothetical protein
MGRGGLYAIAIALCLAAIAGIVVLLVADSSLIELHLAYTAAAILLFGAVVALTASITGRFAWVGWLAAFTAFAAFGTFMGYLWSIKAGYYDNETTGKLTGCLSMFAFALSYAALALSRLRSEDTRPVAALTALTLVAALALATLLSVAIVGDTGNATYFRVAAVIAVLWAFGAALIPVLRGLRSV